MHTVHINRAKKEMSGSRGIIKWGGLKKNGKSTIKKVMPRTLKVHLKATQRAAAYEPKSA